MSQHHSARPYLPDGIRYAFPSNIWGCAMYWLEHRLIFFFWIDVCGGGDTDRPDDRGAKIRKNVTEEIRTHNNIKPVRMPHKMGRQDVDVILIRANIRVICRHLM